MGRGKNMVRLTFAELLSEHGNITRAALQMGQSKSWGEHQFGQICAALGNQAR
jgi:hypothetical protein